jgi:hypothetical protein
MGEGDWHWRGARSSNSAVSDASRTLTVVFEMLMCVLVLTTHAQSRVAHDGNWACRSERMKNCYTHISTNMGNLLRWGVEKVLETQFILAIPPTTW